MEKNNLDKLIDSTTKKLKELSSEVDLVAPNARRDIIEKAINKAIEMGRAGAGFDALPDLKSAVELIEDGKYDQARSVLLSLSLKEIIDTRPLTPEEKAWGLEVAKKYENGEIKF